MTSPEKKARRNFNARFTKKQDALPKYAAEMGDGFGRLEVDGMDGFIYVRINDKPAKIFNNRVPNQAGTAIWVGYSPEEPTKFQVLSTRSASPTGAETGYVGYAPAKRYEWHAPRGGQDPLYIHQRALTFLRLSVSETAPVTFEVYVNVYRGRIWSGAAWVAVARQDVDIYSHIPTTAGKAAFVLFTVNTSGTVVTTKGSEVDIDALALSDIPAAPAATAFICGAVRVYEGQTLVQEGRTNTDIVDLRFTSVVSMGSMSAIGWDVITDKPDLFQPEPGSPYYAIPMQGLYRWVADGATDTFELTDVLEELSSVHDNSLLVDPFEVELSSGGTQVVFSTAPTDGHVIVATGILRTL